MVYKCGNFNTCNQRKLDNGMYTSVKILQILQETVICAENVRALTPPPSFPPPPHPPHGNFEQNPQIPAKVLIP
jgi:hypothetical protein